MDYESYAAAAATGSYAADFSDIYSPEAKSQPAADVAPNLSPNPQVITTAAETPRHSRQPYSFVKPAALGGFETFNEDFRPAADDDFEASEIIGNVDYEASRL